MSTLACGKVQNMENNNMGKFKIEEDALEKVNGGGSTEKGIYYCCYCRRKHTLFRSYPWRIRPAGDTKWYNNACRYDCEVNGSFFSLVLLSGRTAYFDAQGKLLG